MTGFRGRAVVLYEKIRNSGKVCATCTGYVQYEASETVVRCAVRTTESFKFKIGLHQGSSLSPFLFTVIMDKITNKVRRDHSGQCCLLMIL